MLALFFGLGHSTKILDFHLYSSQDGSCGHTWEMQQIVKLDYCYSNPGGNETERTFVSADGTQLLRGYYVDPGCTKLSKDFGDNPDGLPMKELDFRCIPGGEDSDIRGRVVDGDDFVQMEKFGSKMCSKTKEDYAGWDRLFYDTDLANYQGFRLGKCVRFDMPQCTHEALNKCGDSDLCCEELGFRLKGPAGYFPSLKARSASLEKVGAAGYQFVSYTDSDCKNQLERSARMKKNQCYDTGSYMLDPDTTDTDEGPFNVKVPISFMLY